MLQGRVHHVCGNHDQQIDDEYTIAFNGTIESQFSDFDLSTIVPMGNCTVQGARPTIAVDGQCHVNRSNVSLIFGQFPYGVSCTPHSKSKEK